MEVEINMEMFIYKVLNDATKLYDVGIIIASSKDNAKEIVCKKFNSNIYTITVFSKDSICDLFTEEVCVDINELCFTYGYRTENEVKLQKRLNAIQPLINELAYFREM